VRFSELSKEQSIPGSIQSVNFGTILIEERKISRRQKIGEPSCFQRSPIDYRVVSQQSQAVASVNPLHLEEGQAIEIGCAGGGDAFVQDGNSGARGEGNVSAVGLNGRPKIQQRRGRDDALLDEAPRFFGAQLMNCNNVHIHTHPRATGKAAEEHPVFRVKSQNHAKRQHPAQEHHTAAGWREKSQGSQDRGEIG